MKRRTAIGRILLAGGASAAVYVGYEWFEVAKKPAVSFLLSKKELLTALADTIIPPTDTPGAKEAGVLVFLIPLLIQCTDKKTLNRFIEGLQDLEAYTHSRYQSDFMQCSAEEKDNVLHYFEDQAAPPDTLLGKVSDKLLGKSFFETLRQYSVESYCISETGATRALRYIPVPGRYQGCLPMEPGQNAWATN